MPAEGACAAVYDLRHRIVTSVTSYRRRSGVIFVTLAIASSQQTH